MNTIKYLVLSTFIATFFLAIAIVAFGTPSNVIKTINEERSLVAESMGPEALERSVRRTNDLYKYFTPAIKSSLNFLNDDQQIEQIRGKNNQLNLHSLRIWYNEAIESFWNLIYQSVQRMSIIYELFPIFCLILVPACVDGFTVRQVRITSFGYTSPLFYQLGFIGLAGLIVGLLFLATVPFAVPFEFYTAWMLTAVYFMRSICANTQKKV
jgi:hypothetical protein